MTTENISAFNGHLPQLHATSMVASSAQVIGKVTLGQDVSIWFNTVVRGDVEPIEIGDRTNIQDLSMVHVTSGEFSTKIGSDVTVGHRAILHGCTVGNGCMIGMGSIVLDGVELGEFCLVGAGSVVSPGKKFPARSVIMGVPGRLVREVTDAEVQWFLNSAKHYVDLAREYGSAFRTV